jgi:hypothetical protein
MSRPQRVRPRQLAPFLVILLLALVAFALALPSNTPTALAQTPDREGSSKLPSPNQNASGLVTNDLSGALTPEDLANALVGAGISISNVSYTGADVAGGQFSGGGGIIGFDGGIILSSGDLVNVVGPNTVDNVTRQNGQPGDADLSTLSGFTTFDAAVLEFDFVPATNSVSFRYVFASDEYNEFVNTQFNDVFAFFVNGVNCAVVGGEPVSINVINNGNPFNTDPRSHPELYRNNDLSDGGGSIDTEMDGLTTILTCTMDVAANNPNHLKLAIADASDQSFDSAVFIEAQSLTAFTPTPTFTPTDIGTPASPTPSRTPTKKPTAIVPPPAPTSAPPAEVPEPGTLLLLGSGAGGLASYLYVKLRYRRRKSDSSDSSE